MLKNNPKYFVKNIVQFVQNSRDTGAVEKIIQQNTVKTDLLDFGSSVFTECYGHSDAKTKNSQGKGEQDLEGQSHG
jgi:hypothetical protein